MRLIASRPFLPCATTITSPAAVRRKASSSRASCSSSSITAESAIRSPRGSHLQKVQRPRFPAVNAAALAVRFSAIASSCRPYQTSCSLREPQTDSLAATLREYFAQLEAARRFIGLHDTAQFRVHPYMTDLALV